MYLPTFLRIKHAKKAEYGVCVYSSVLHKEKLSEQDPAEKE